MAGKVLMRFVTYRTLLELTVGAKRGGIGRTSRFFWSRGRWTAGALGSGGAAFLVGLPVLSGLSYKAFRKVQSSAVVCALDKEFLWRLARASRDLSVLPGTDAGRKKQLTFEAFEYAKRALERDDKCFAAHKWYAICLSDTGEFQGIKVKIGNSYIIREHLEVTRTSGSVSRNKCATFIHFILPSRGPLSSTLKMPHPYTFWVTGEKLIMLMKTHELSDGALLFDLEALEFFLKAEEGRTDCTETTEAITELLLLSLVKIRGILYSVVGVLQCVSTCDMLQSGRVSGVLSRSNRSPAQASHELNFTLGARRSDPGDPGQLASCDRGDLKWPSYSDKNEGITDFHQWRSSSAVDYNI
ncbi:hypothetical protein XENOCAPTIV_017177 [Xenoophorus captivus]|uniref:Uncharacterized protein n=1 Tax=Xenoophorus captivus TaxID=1517983 RepID=A0ABV0QX97_9TELE